MISDSRAFQSSISRHSIREDARQIAKIIVDRGCGSVLDLGSGIGILAELLRQYGILVYEIEGSWDMLNAAKDHRRVSGGAVQGVITRLPCSTGAVASVVLSFVLHHLKGTDRKACLIECSRVLKEEGELFIVERVPRSDFIFRIFPRYWDVYYRKQHEWYEDRPEVRTLQMLNDELGASGFVVEDCIRLREPLDKLVKALAIPKMIVIAKKQYSEPVEG